MSSNTTLSFFTHSTYGHNVIIKCDDDDDDRTAYARFKPDGKQAVLQEE